MASKLATRRLASYFSRLEVAKVCSPAVGKSFSSAAVRVQHEGPSPVQDQSSKAEKQVPSSPSGNRAPWPRSFLPGLFHPFGQQPTSLTQMLDAVDQLFDGSLGPTTSSRSVGNMRRTPWDVMEDDKCFRLRVDMPGLSKDEVNVSVEDGHLVMKAEHNVDANEDDWSSRSTGSYNVRIKLPENVDYEGIKAEMKNGVLKVQAPKVEGKKKHEIQIS